MGLKKIIGVVIGLGFAVSAQSQVLVKTNFSVNDLVRKILLTDSSGVSVQHRRILFRYGLSSDKKWNCTFNRVGRTHRWP